MMSIRGLLSIYSIKRSSGLDRDDAGAEDTGASRAVGTQLAIIDPSDKRRTKTLGRVLDVYSSRLAYRSMLCAN